jgi:hypothetical protein
MKLSGFKTKRKALEEGLKLLIDVQRHRHIRPLRGKLSQSCRLRKMRTDT